MCKPFTDVRTHYDLLSDEGNDPVLDSPALQAYMDRWDGQSFIDHMQLSPDQSVLEIGVGTGRLAVRVAPLCGRFTGIDLSPRSLARAREHLAHHTHVTLLEGDFLAYPFTQIYDVVYSSLTFMHIADKQRAISKIASLLAPSGRFVLSIDKNPSDTLDLGTRQIRIYPDSPDQTAHAFAQAGLTVIAQEETAFAHLFVAVR